MKNNIIEIINRVCFTPKHPWNAEMLANEIVDFIDSTKPFSKKVQKGSLEDVEFKGATYVPERDRTRLTEQCKRVFNLMKDGQWRTKDEIASKTQSSPHGVSSRFSDIKRLGLGYTKKQYVKNGLYKYRLIKL